MDLKLYDTLDILPRLKPWDSSRGILVICSDAEHPAPATTFSPLRKIRGESLAFQVGEDVKVGFADEG